MILINEIVRPTIKEKPYSIGRITAINSSTQTKEKCSWACHNNTTYCKENHVKLSNRYFKTLDPVYFGIIKLLKSTGNYALANIIIFVIIFPLLMVYLLIKSLNMRSQIRKLKRNNERID